MESRKEQKPILLNRFSVKNLQLCGFRADYNGSEYDDLFCFCCRCYWCGCHIERHFIFAKSANHWLEHAHVCNDFNIYMCEFECHKNFMNLNNTRTMHKICAMWVEYNRFATFPTEWAIFVGDSFDSLLSDVRVNLVWESKQCDWGYLFNPPSNWYRTI